MKPLNLLVVEDDGLIRQVIELVLSRAGHHVSVAMSVVAGCAHLNCAHFDVIITDVLLGDDDCTDLIRCARQLQPQARVVVMSGGANFLTTSFGVDLSTCVPLLKPFTPEELLAAVHGAIASLDARAEGAA